MEYLWSDALSASSRTTTKTGNKKLPGWERSTEVQPSPYQQLDHQTCRRDFLRPRSSTVQRAVILYSKCSNSNETGKIAFYTKPGTIYEVLDRSPVNSRGWCLQERILSRRVIHFCEDQVYWECDTESYAEDGTVLDSTSSFKRQLADVEHSQTTILRGWHNLLEDYMRRNLSNPCDIFPAIAGLADTVRRYLPEKSYHAGIWEQELPFGLLWSTPVASDTRISAISRAPSWSWAAITCPS